MLAGGLALSACLAIVVLLLCDVHGFVVVARYYLKERAFHGTLVQDEEAEVS